MESRLRASPMYKSRQVVPSTLDASKERRGVGSMSLGQCDMTPENSDNC